MALTLRVQVQINIGGGLDYDAEVEGLSAQVRGIKQVGLCLLNWILMGVVHGL